MQLFKANIKPISSYTSPLQSDTFFGAFCWSYKYLYGEEKLEEFLKKNTQEGAQIIFSNAFPENRLPLPMGIYDTKRKRYAEVTKEEAKITYQRNKVYKKCGMIQKQGFMEIQKGACEGYSEFLEKEEVKIVGVTHNSSSRDPEVEREGTLFVTDETFCNIDSTFDVYILTTFSKDELTEVLNLMFELGIGGSKSTGKGAFRMLSLDCEDELLNVPDANGFVALSNFIPAEDDPGDGNYKMLTKFGKLDREFAEGRYPFKKPMLYIKAGATFHINEKVKPYYGTFMQNIAVPSKVVVNACTIAVPVKFQEE